MLFSTLRQAPFDGQQKRVSITCQSELKAIPCKDSESHRGLHTDVQADTGPHSLISRTSSHTHVAFMFLDPVSMTSMTVGGVRLLFLLGAITCAIITVVWIVCTAVVSRIRPITRKRTIKINIKHYVISGKQPIIM